MCFVEDILVQPWSWPLVLFIVLLALWHSTRRSPGFPPGPTRVPVVGNLLSLRGDVRKAFVRMRKEYGDVFSLYLGSKLVIVFNGYDTLKDAFVKNADIFSERPTGLVYEKFTKGRGIVVGNGKMWREQRRFALSALRDLGVGKNTMETKILEEITPCLKCMEDTNGQPFDFQYLIAAAVCNIICSLVFGKRFEYDDPEFIHYLKSVNTSVKIVGGTSAIHFLPALKYLPGDPYNFKHLHTSDVEMHTFVSKHIARHRKEFDGINIQDFIDAYILETEKQQKVDPDSTFNDDTLGYVIREFFVAGTETTATTLRWALLHLAVNPDEQTKIQAEVQSVIGHSRLPTMADRKSLPYTEAAIMEIQRLADVVPFSVPHGVTSDTTFKGYTIPKDALLFPNISSVLGDSSLWADPDQFRPSRFLCEDGKVCRDASVIPFFMGKRVCLGESLARMELFLALTAILQKFTFRLPEGEPPPSLEGTLGITRMPHAYRICAIKRK